jgi:hypothetical protein
MSGVESAPGRLLRLARTGSGSALGQLLELYRNDLAQRCLLGP